MGEPSNTNLSAQIGYFLKNLDLNNINNAYLSGMEEDLGMYGVSNEQPRPFHKTIDSLTFFPLPQNQLVTSTSIFTVGYVIGQIPSNLLLTRVSPRWVIPSVCIFLVPRDTRIAGDCIADIGKLARGWLGNCHHLQFIRQIISVAICNSVLCRTIRVSWSLYLFLDGNYYTCARCQISSSLITLNTYTRV